MQAQQGPGGGGSSLATALQNRNVQIGVGVVGLVVLLVVIGILVMGNQNSGGTSTAIQPPPGQTLSGPSSSMTGGDDMPAPSTVPGGATFGMPGGGMPGMAGAGGTARPATPASTDPPKRQAKGVATRGLGAFEPNSELKKVIAEVPPPPRLPDAIADPHLLYEELNPPKPVQQVSSTEEDESGGPPIPPMRVAGFVEGAQLSAIIQIGSGAGGQYEQATPGKIIRYGANTYRVASIEQGKVMLVNDWEIGERKGTQRIEVLLAPAASRVPGFAAPIYGGPQPGGVGPSAGVTPGDDK